MRAGLQTCDITGKTAQTAAVNGQTVVYRGILGCAPTYPSGRHGCHALVGHITATGGSRAGDIAHGGSRYRWCRNQCGELMLCTIDRARIVGGVGPHIVMGVGQQTRDIACEITQTAAVNGQTVVYRGIR